MNEKVEKYLSTLRGLNNAEANFIQVNQECARKINEARQAYENAALAHAANGGSYAYDTGCGQFTFCAPTPDYMVDYYAIQMVKENK